MPWNGVHNTSNVDINISCNHMYASVCSLRDKQREKKQFGSDYSHFIHFLAVLLFLVQVQEKIFLRKKVRARLVWELHICE